MTAPTETQEAPALPELSKPRKRSMKSRPAPVVELPATDATSDPQPEPVDPERLERIRDLEEEIVVAKERHEHDLALAGNVLLRNSNIRNWGRDYDNVTQILNKHLSHPLPTRGEDYVVTMAVTFTVPGRVDGRMIHREDIKKIALQQLQDALGLKFPAHATPTDVRAPEWRY